MIRSTFYIFIFLFAILSCESKTATRKATPKEMAYYKSILNKKWTCIFESGPGNAIHSDAYHEFYFYNDSTSLIKIIYSDGDTGDYGREDDVIELDENGNRINPNAWHISGDTLFTRMGYWIIEKLTTDSMELNYFKKNKLSWKRIYITKD